MSGFTLYSAGQLALALLNTLLLLTLIAADALLVLTHVFKASKNVTSNEMINRDRFVYIQKAPFFCAFDRGTAANMYAMLTAYASERAEWYNPPPVMNL